MSLIEVKEWKDVECDDCGRVTKIPKWVGVRESWCKECGSLKIRLYKPPTQPNGGDSDGTTIVS